MPKLVVTDLDQTFLVDLPVGETLLVGRASACGLRIHAPRASRRHLEIVEDGEGHRLRDLGSMNGTTLGGAPFTGDAPLSDGDVVDASGCRIVYRSRP